MKSEMIFQESSNEEVAMVVAFFLFVIENDAPFVKFTKVDSVLQNHFQVGFFFFKLQEIRL